MKKSSLLALSLVSLVGLVGCSKQEAKAPAGKACASRVFKDITGEKGKFTKEPAPHIEQTQFIDPLSKEGPEADIYLIEDMSDSYEFCFYLFQFEKTADGYVIEEEGTTYTFTLAKLNNLGNNIMYDFFAPEDPEEEFQVSYRRGKWLCTAVYEAIEKDDDGNLVSSYCEFADAVGKDGEPSQDAITVYADCLFYVVDEEVEEKTLSYLFCTVKILSIKDLMA